MRLTLLGTGSPTPMINRASSGYMLEVGDEVLLIDHGGGAHENFLRTGRSATEVNTLFLSHLHTDHCLDYPRLVHSRWDQGAGQIPDLTVHAPKEAQRMSELLFGEEGVYRVDLNGRMNSTGSRVVYENRGGVLPRKRPQPDVQVLHDGKVIEGGAWRATAREVYHQPGFIEPYALRFETEDGVLVYSGDTGPCNAIREIAENADILIHMCYFVSGTFEQADGTLTSSGHREAARTARDAGVKTLVCTHFTPQIDALGVKERCLAEMAEIFPGRIIWGEDLISLGLEIDDLKGAG